MLTSSFYHLWNNGSFGQRDDLQGKSFSMWFLANVNSRSRSLYAIAFPSVCLSVVCNVRAPYSASWNFRQFFFAFWYLGYLLTSAEHFTEIVPGNPSVGGFKRKRGSEIKRLLHLWNAVSLKRCKIRSKLVLINNRKSYMSTKIGDIEWPWTAKWPLFCIISPNSCTMSS